jgi:putative redox protein
VSEASESTTPPNDKPKAEGGQWVTAHIDRRHYRTEIEARGRVFTLDEPADVGGTDTGPTPYEVLLAAIGGCTAMTLRMYADRKAWPLEHVYVRLRTARSHEPDCEMSDRKAVGPHRIERHVELVGPLSDEQRQRLMQIADRCPVKQTLERGVHFANAETAP